MTFTKYLIEIIETNPKILHGMPVIKGTRIPVARILALIGMDYNVAKLKKEFPDLKEFRKRDIENIFSYYKDLAAQ